MTNTPENAPINRRILVWVREANRDGSGAWQLGWAFKRHKGDGLPPKLYADGYNGDWQIPTWADLPPAPDGERGGEVMNPNELYGLGPRQADPLGRAHQPTPEERIAKLVAALTQSTDALSELMACSSEMLNSRVARGLYKQCHDAAMNAGAVLRAEMARKI